MSVMQARVTELETVQALFDSTSAELEQTAAMLGEVKVTLEETEAARAAAEELKAKVSRCSRPLLATLDVCM
jgi:hypothetical protein